MMPEGFSSQAVGTAVQDCPFEPSARQEPHWIEVELLGEDDQPVAWEAYLVTLPDGTQVPGFLDGAGFARLSGLADAAPCRISFPQLDRDAFAFLTTLPTQRRTETAVVADARVPALLAAEINHKVVQGENLESIAFLYGHASPTIWEHASNAALKSRRDDPNVLLPGDVVFVPALRTQAHSAATDARHRFRRKGVPSTLRFRALVGNQALANQPYMVEVDSKEYSGNTNANGMLECFVPPDAPSAVVHVGIAPLRWTFRLRLRAVDPINEISGVQTRLANLGYVVPEISGALDEPTRAALLAFQSNEGLAQSGQPDEPTRSRLQAAHGN